MVEQRPVCPDGLSGRLWVGKIGCGKPVKGMLYVKWEEMVMNYPWSSEADSA